MMYNLRMTMTCLLKALHAYISVWINQKVNRLAAFLSHGELSLWFV